MTSNIKLKANITANFNEVLLAVCRENDGQFCWYVNVNDKEEILEDTYPVDSLSEAEYLLFNFYPRWVYNTEILHDSGSQ